jgi:hypothetical protein
MPLPLGTRRTREVRGALQGRGEPFIRPTRSGGSWIRRSIALDLRRGPLTRTGPRARRRPAHSLTYREASGVLPQQRKGIAAGARSNLRVCTTDEWNRSSSGAEPRSDSWEIQESASWSTDLSRYRQGEKVDRDWGRALVGAGRTSRVTVGRSMQPIVTPGRDVGGDPVPGVTEQVASSKRRESRPKITCPAPNQRIRWECATARYPEPNALIGYPAPTRLSSQIKSIQSGQSLRIA